MAAGGGRSKRRTPEPSAGSRSPMPRGPLENLGEGLFGSSWLGFGICPFELYGPLSKRNSGALFARPAVGVVSVILTADLGVRQLCLVILCTLAASPWSPSRNWRGCQLPNRVGPKGVQLRLLNSQSRPGRHPHLFYISIHVHGAGEDGRWNICDRTSWTTGLSFRRPAQASGTITPTAHRHLWLGLPCTSFQGAEHPPSLGTWERSLPLPVRNVRWRTRANDWRPHEA